MNEFFVFVVFVLLVVVIVGAIGVSVGMNEAKTGICEESGFDGYELIDGVDYCYTGKDADIVFVPLLVGMPEEGQR